MPYYIYVSNPQRIATNAETRKEILMKYLKDKNKLRQLIEEEKLNDIRNTLLVLSIRNFEHVFGFI